MIYSIFKKYLKSLSSDSVIQTALGKMAADTCCICIERYNKTNHAKITCCFCDQDVCRECGKRYILDQNNPSCMHCKREWNREFIDANFTKVFRNGDLKRKREEVLLGIEEAMLPDTQHSAAIEKECRELTEEKQKLAKKAKELAAELAKYRNEITGIDIKIMRRRNSRENDASAEKRAFIKHCPVNGCNGFLTTQYNCGLCRVKVCTKCLVPKGENADEHTCDPNTLATVEMLIKDTRPCPKCAAPIHKIDGCDQMWCTQCQTAFSWRTGRIETGTVHNPHWYEYQRRVNNGIIPRVPGDNPGGCGDNNLPRLVMIPNTKRTEKLLLVHRQLTHIQHVVLPRYQGNYRANDNRDLRIKYLLGDITKDKWKKLLQQREKRREKELAIRQALDVLVHGSSDILNRLIEDKVYAWTQAEQELDTLRDYTNECLQNVCDRFNCNARLHINPNWVI